MAKDNHHRRCNCHAPDPKRGYCQNCGEKSWPESTRYEDLRAKFDAEMRDRVDHPLKYMKSRDPVDQIRELIDIGAPDVLERIAEVLGFTESRPTPEQSGEALDARNIESYRIWAISEGVTTTTLGYKIWRAAIDAAMDRSALGREGDGNG